MKIKNILLLFLMFTNNILSKSDLFNPSNTVIAFDFHGVVARVSLRGMTWAFFKIPARELLEIFPSLPFIIRDLINYRINHEISEKILAEMGDKYPIVKRLENDVIRMANQQKPKQYMVSVLKQLKAMGYPLVLASNIGEKIFADLKMKSSPQMQELLSLFDTFVTPTEGNGYHYKPHSPYFMELTSLFPEKNIIFFDDKAVNRHGAQEQGIYAFDTGNIIATLEGLHILKGKGMKA